jgi:hypothetical protein
MAIGLLFSLGNGSEPYGGLGAGQLGAAETYAALVPSAPVAMGTCRVTFKDVVPVASAEGFGMFGLARCPGDPENYWYSVCSLAP